jgi:hypothetical protein
MLVKFSMRDSLDDPKLFANVMKGESWYGWRVLLIAAAGEELTDEERIEFKRLTGREREPGRMCRELICIFGRRAGKSTAMIVFNLWNACCCDYSDKLAIGLLDRTFEIMIASEPLRSMIINKTADTIELDNHCNIEVRPCSYQTLRGPTYVSIVCDELAFWFTSANFANPDSEVLTAVKPGTLTTKGPVLMVSSAYAKTGVLYNYYKQYFGPNGPDDILVAYGTTRDMNTSISQQDIDRAIERDPVANRAEYLSEWRIDAEGFVPREVVERCIYDKFELLPRPGVSYRCFIDPASGIEGGDSFAITIGHKVGDRRVIVDAIREVRPPFNYFEVVNTVLVPLCKSYKIYKVIGDNFGGELAKAPVRKAGLGFELAEKHKSELYRDPFLGMLNACEIEIPKFDRAINQICSLERSVQRSGRDQITHPSGGHDDIANSIAGVVDLVLSSSGYRLDVFDPAFIDEDRREPAEPEPQFSGNPCNGDWWRWRPPPRTPLPTAPKVEPPKQQPTNECDKTLIRGYRDLDVFIRGGGRF